MSPTTKTWINKIIALLCIVGSVLAIYNVSADPTEVQTLAEKVACGETGCHMLLGMQRTPISQSLTFQVQANTARTQAVSCSRAFVLFGEFTCKRE